MFEGMLNRLEAQYTDVAARRTTAAAPAARLEILHAAAGMMRVRNPYLQRCSSVIDRALRGRNSAARAVLEGWLCVFPWEGEWSAGPGALAAGTYCSFDVERAIGRSTISRRMGAGVGYLLATFPWVMLGEGMPAPSIYYVRAGVMRDEPARARRTHGFDQARGWRGMGFKKLLAAAWRPDYAATDSACVGRLHHPPIQSCAPQHVSPPSADRWVPECELLRNKDCPSTRMDTVTTDLALGRLVDFRYSVSYCRWPAGEAGTEGSAPWGPSLLRAPFVLPRDSGGACARPGGELRARPGKAAARGAIRRETCGGLDAL